MLHIKKILDVIISTVLLIILLPIFIFIVLLVKTTSKGPIFYKCKWIGKNEKPFTGYKFRTMIPNADNLKTDLLKSNEMTGPVFKMTNDPRITKVGKFLRKYSLDELPQLWSVLKGEMSLVGPRPAGPHEWRKYEDWQKRKLSVTPGMTCLWQINGRNEVHEFDAWVKMDLEYIDKWNLLLDFKILLKTIPVVLKGTGH
jgi:lipopolysaccharide/colanic/teichoic acid biosynthesis glycosyltransferase